MPRLVTERDLLGMFPSPRPQLGVKSMACKVDKLSCIQFGSARYSVPSRLISATVTVVVSEGHIHVVEPVTGEVIAEHPLVAPGESSVLDEHYGNTRAGKTPILLSCQRRARSIISSRTSRIRYRGGVCVSGMM